MPQISIKHVVSFSSEDQNYQAENLVKSDGYKKWRTVKGGEKQASVTLQLEKASVIHQIDIGNEFSAFVEVLVGKSDASDDEYQVLLVASSFMNPLESRGGQNGSKVRMFTAAQLSKTAKDLKWDRIKIVCTQPFNKTIQYGLSFIKFHSPPSDEDKASSSASSPKKQMKLGAFSIRSDSDSENISAGSLFAQRKKEPISLTGAAAVRAASKLAEESTPKREPAPSTSKTLTDPSTSTSKTPTMKRRHSGEDGFTPSSSSHAKSKEVTQKRPSPAKPIPLKKQSTSVSSIASSVSSRDSVPPLKRTKTEPPKQSKEKQFSRLMEKVTFVMSGFKNPFRGELRDKAVEMGAVYKPEWGRGCTHLICAYDNTPKYKEVKGKGKIVKKEWLLDCHKSKKLIPWRKYRLGRAKTPPGSSDESSDDEDHPAHKKTPTPSKRKNSQESPKGKTPTQVSKGKKEDPGYDDSTDVSGMDTEDELERIKAGNEKSPKGKKSHAKAEKTSTAEQKNTAIIKGDDDDDDDDVYNKSTDEEMGDNTSSPTTACNGKEKPSTLELDDLIDLFTGKAFFLYGKFSAQDQRLLFRYIMAYDGEMQEYMNDKVNYVITDSEWDTNFDDAERKKVRSNKSLADKIYS